MKPEHHAEINMDSNEVDLITELLAANSQKAVDGFRICSEPSIEACQALALLVSDCRANARLFTANITRAHSASSLGRSRGPGL
ncbi:hypothetical protein IMZ48_21965 [Candidatus Bathyarchaeota archaeon]|nr:hypothetical protein [Candidatus Bathyarchaeota archaeon]